MKKLGLGVNCQFGLPIEKQIELFKQTGFDAFFTDWKPQDYPIKDWAKLSKDIGIIYQSIHAPYSRCADMWSNDKEQGEGALKELIDCLHDCARYEVPIMVSHTWIGFDYDKSIAPCEIGLERFGRLIKLAESLGVKIAFENTEGEEFLGALMKNFSDSSAVGFCWDTGHEMCYNYSKDMLSLYGDRLICTHLNDNLGISDPNGKITFLDDLHLLPFDGVADWSNIALRLNKCTFDEILTFELNTLSKPGRRENDKYAEMAIDKYIEECYKRACRVSNLLAV